MTNKLMQMPGGNTDARRMLCALLAAYPLPAWNLNHKLELTAHSRASDLRRLGWDVEHVSRARARGGRKRDHGYLLTNDHDSVVASRDELDRVAV